VCALSEDGAIEIANSATQVFEQISGAGLMSESRMLGPLRRIREIAHSLYACGAGNQVYMRTANGWVGIDDQLVAASKAATTRIIDQIKDIGAGYSEDKLLSLTASISDAGVIDDIGGTGPDDVYACGLAGAMWHWNGHQWRELKTPSDEHLHCMHVISEQSILVCGHNGTLLQGNKDTGFRSLIGSDSTDHFWSVREFNGKTYLGTTKGLHVFDGTRLELVRLPGQLDLPVVHAVDSTDNALWVVAERFAARLVGDQWQRFDHPDNI
jgi:hypothetical protein